jgi:hypothetical protein
MELPTSAISHIDFRTWNDNWFLQPARLRSFQIRRNPFRRMRVVRARGFADSVMSRRFDLRRGIL